MLEGSTDHVVVTRVSKEMLFRFRLLLFRKIKTPRTERELVPEGVATLYYPPLSIPKSPGTTNNKPSKTKQCSIRGCTLLLSLSSSNKMCETCRGRHRVYVSKKRARRKMEKAAVAGVVAARAGVGEVGGGNGGENGGVTMLFNVYK